MGRTLSQRGGGRNRQGAVTRIEDHCRVGGSFPLTSTLSPGERPPRTSARMASQNRNGGTPAAEFRGGAAGVPPFQFMVREISVAPSGTGGPFRLSATAAASLAVGRGIEGEGDWGDHRFPRVDTVPQQHTGETQFFGGRAKILVFIAWMSLSLLAAAAPAAPFLVELASPTAPAGGTILIRIVGLNPTAVPTTIHFPAQIEAALTVGTTRDEIVLRPVTLLAEDGLPVAANGFARVEYSAVVPARLNGSVQLEIAIENSPSFTVEVHSTEITAADPTLDNMKKFSVREAMDRQTTETSFFKRHVFPYEPFYFLAGPDAPAVKFQVSIKYRLVNTEVGDDGEAEGWLYRNAHWMDGLHLAYTQRSLWDIQAESAPFLDSSYMPELLYELPRLIDPEHGWIERIGAQVGFQHESNGKDGASSRSLNIAYVRLPFVFGDEDDFYVSLEPRAWFYVGDLSDNPDLTDYRGYLDLRLKAGWARGVQVAGWLRSGRDFNHGSVQVDLTYPLHNLLSRSFSLYLQAQYFNGYGESLLYYDQRSEIWRVGLGLFR